MNEPIRWQPPWAWLFAILMVVLAVTFVLVGALLDAGKPTTTIRQPRHERLR